MDVELQINNSLDPAARFVTWAPSPCRVRVTNASGVPAPTVSLRLTGRSAAAGGAIVLRKNATGNFANQITVNVPTNGSTTTFYIAGRFGRPSTNNGDVTLEARRGNTLVGSVPLMVRVRKNANTL